MATSNLAPAQQRKINEALTILEVLNLPRQQRNQRSALTLLALAEVGPTTAWSKASAPLRGIHEMMIYFGGQYGVTYAENTRETIRRQTIHQFVQLGLVLENPDKPTRPTNSPATRYQLEPNALTLLRTFGTHRWSTALASYLATADALRQLHAKERAMTVVPVHLPNGATVALSGGGQNRLIKQIIEEFCARFTPGGVVVYVGDAGQKFKMFDQDYLKALGVEIETHGKMPDVIVHFVDKNWLVLIEAVTSHGPVNIKRHNELRKLFAGSQAGVVYVTAFESRVAMMKYLPEIAWETEVWVAESPSHLIHFNGERFLGPYSPTSA